MQITKSQHDALRALAERSPRLLLATPHRELKELVSAGYIELTASSESDVGYAITEAGRQLLADQPSNEPSAQRQGQSGQAQT